MEISKIAASSTGSSLALSSLAAFVGLCCVGPIAVTLFGVSGAVVLARLEPARPYVLVAATLLVLLTAFITYVQPLLTSDRITRNLSQHVFFGVSFGLVVLAAFADELIGWLQ